MRQLRLKNWAKQKYFLGAAVLFLAVFGGLVAVRSQSRKSVLSFGGGSAGAIEAALNGSGLQLKDFHRVQLKHGNLVWEIRARGANYFASENVTQVTDAEVTIHRPKQAPVVLTARAAKLYMNGDSLGRADLEGDITLRSEGSPDVMTENATYNVETRIVSAPGLVSIRGTGYRIESIGLEMSVDTQVITLLRDVTTSVEPGARGPTGELLKSK
jgi:LPS export ABC transporter protein LptC